MPKKSHISQKRWRKWWRDYKKKLPHWAVSFESSKLAADFIKLLRKYHIAKGKILEIGCGNGRDSFFFALQGFNVTGVDIAPEALNLCNQKRADFIKKRKIKKSQIQFLLTDAENLPFRDESFTGGYSIGVFHSTNLGKSLKELARVIKQNGLVMIHLYEKTVFLPSKKIERYYSAREIKSILARLPFRVLKFESNITRRGYNYDEKIGSHKHFSIILSLRKL
jgi:ubiquinone/menaquinone biosynthesis C-methylase UbiE